MGGDQQGGVAHFSRQCRQFLDGVAQRVQKNSRLCCHTHVIVDQPLHVHGFGKWTQIEPDDRTLEPIPHVALNSHERRTLEISTRVDGINGLFIGQRQAGLILSGGSQGTCRAQG
jgi:hypothetical protein